MPIYEYWCRSCRKKSSFFVRSVSSPLDPYCQSCGSANVQRAVSTFSYHKSLPSRWEEAGAPEDASPDYYEDPSNVGRWVEKRWKETMGDEPLPGEIQEMIGTAREGEMPKPLRGLPDFPDPLRDL